MLYYTNSLLYTWFFVRILGVHRSESAHQGTFLQVSESALMVLAITFFPFPLTGIGYVCYNNRWSPKTTVPSTSSGEYCQDFVQESKQKPQFHRPGSLENR